MLQLGKMHFATSFALHVGWSVALAMNYDADNEMNGSDE